MPARRPIATALAAPLLALALALPAPAQGLDLGSMTDDERAAFRAEVRAYLLENPEVLMEAIAVLEEREAEAQVAADAEMIAARADALFEDADSWTGGNPEGDITIVEFIDYRCGYCRRAFPEVQELVASDGDIRLVVKEFPILGEQSVLASRFAIATRMVAGDDAYKQVHDALITLRGDMNELSLELMGEELGLPVEEIVGMMGDEAVTEVIRANHALAEDLGISGTPTYVLGDRMVRGYVPLEGMRALVAEERAEG
ncbi:DsbA family protein [Rhodovulum sp. 12E13]|uniref:DsbA family protein n=1 Tax=Rhodovulum sp. 12E13 TaxID=2203891 RepID=UPI000E188EC1|nr:DsbA family protein [Rhodovulum sp. 12E13]RDC71892.1 DsbA family protein [Rhodovulum sp. 12E13]